MPVCEEKKVSIWAEGDMGKIQIEENGVGDCEETTVKNIGDIPRDLLKPSPPPAYSSVSVANSENVHFGNNTFFNGPVTIKQMIQCAVQDNLGYVETDDEIIPPSNPSQKEDPSKCVWDVVPFEKKWWIKMGMIAFSLMVIGAIFTFLIIVVYNATQDNKDKITLFKENDFNCNLVEGICIDINLVKMAAIPFGLIFISRIWYWLYKLSVKYILTRNCCQNLSAPKQMHKLLNHHNKTVEDDPLLIAPDHLRIVSRTNWLAGPVEKPINKLRLPVPWVIITHTDTESCSIQSECVLKVRLIQMFHVESREWNDIGYNYLVGGDGSAYYGRGWDYEGAHTLGYNKYSIAIAFIGNFNTRPPPKKQVEACQKLIKRGVELGKIAKDYKLFGHRQLSSTLSPGDKLYEIIQQWPHFVNNDTAIEKLIPNY